MIHIRPISDLRNKFTEIESTVNEGQAIFLTKNGYGSMVVLSLERYSELTNDIESKLDYADHLASLSNVRYSHEDVFSRLKEGLHE